MIDPSTPSPSGKKPTQQTRSSMSPEAQRIAIAEACGWTFRDDGLQNISPQGGKWSTVNDNFEGVPNYLSDLNAMHAAIGSLSGDKVLQFCTCLSDVTGAWAMSLRQYQIRALVMATAAQRAEAFLKTIGKWTAQ